MRSDPTFWILARASGLTAYLLLTASVVAGLVVKARPFGRRVKQASVTELHRFLALLGLGAIVLHGVTLLLDRTVHLAPLALLVPGLSTYRPLATGIGVLTAELMVVVYASFALRNRIGFRNWRRLHYATFAIFAGATVHGLAAGTDTARLFFLYIGAVGAVVFATVWRMLTTEPTKGGTPRVQGRDRPVAL